MNEGLKTNTMYNTVVLTWVVMVLFVTTVISRAMYMLVIPNLNSLL